MREREKEGRSKQTCKKRVTKKNGRKGYYKIEIMKE